MRHEIKASPKEEYEGGCIYFDTDNGQLIIDGSCSNYTSTSL